MRPKTKAILGLLILAGLCVGVWLLVPRGPSVSPEEVARRWAAVQRWTGVEGALGRPVFGGTFDRTPSSATVVGEALGRWRAGEVPVMDPQTIPAPYRAEMDQILAWAAAPRFEGSCADPTVSALAVYARLRAVLMTAAAKDVARVKQALAVARAIRARGSLLMTMVGLQVTTSVAEWARARGVPVWPDLRAAAPTPEEFVQAMAREAVCTAEMFVREAGEDGAVLLALESYKTDAHARLAPLQIPNPTFDTLLAAMPAPPADNRDPMLEVLAVNQKSMLERFATEAKRFEGLIAAP